MSFIETERLIVRKWDPGRDLDDTLEMYGDAQTMRFIPCGVLTREQTERLILRLMERDERHGFGIWPVVLKSERRVIGVCGIAHIPDYANDVEIAWTFNKAYYGNGYATEAARGVMQYAFDEVRLQRLYALIDRANPKSIAVARRLGMDFDRIIRAYKRDLMRYRIQAN